MKNILLCSGGLDSMVIYHEYKEEIDECVYIRYRGGHPSTIQELELLERERIPVTIIDIDNLSVDERGFYYGRNLKFMLAVREYFAGEDINVFVGNTANDGFSDNTRWFFYALEDIINKSYPNTLRITCPLENRTKRSLIKEAKEEGVHFYFCDTGNDEPCMKCHSCKAMIDGGYFDED